LEIRLSSRLPSGTPQPTQQLNAKPFRGGKVPTNLQNSRIALKDPALIKRKTIQVVEEESVRLGAIEPGRSLPLVIEPLTPGMNLGEWIAAHRVSINEWLRDRGGILFRGFPVRTLEDFEKTALALSGEMAEYVYRSTPRTKVQNRIYTSTEYPPNQTIPMHNENSYAAVWPMKIWFFCQKAAEQDGQTPIADSRLVYRRMDPKIRNKFAEKKVMYVRNYGNDIDLPWQTVFQTEDKAAVESYCREASIEWQWIDDTRLRTWQIRDAVATHPQTGDIVWFNQAHLFHLSSLEPDVQKSLLETCGEEFLPRQTKYGDGTPIGNEELDEIRRVYADLAVEFDWQPGDLLLLDNMLTAHGRRPFHGSRRILVAMAEPVQE
jgi:alpha-ketoglutarate-dependent taurine dioxygenase